MQAEELVFVSLRILTKFYLEKVQGIWIMLRPRKRVVFNYEIEHRKSCQESTKRPAQDTESWKIVLKVSSNLQVITHLLEDEKITSHK